MTATAPADPTMLRIAKRAYHFLTGGSRSGPEPIDEAKRRQVSAGVVGSVRELLHTSLFTGTPNYDATGIIAIHPPTASTETVRPDGVWFPRHHPGPSLELAAKLFDQLKGEVIVEIGSGLQGPMSGDSAIVWATQTKAKGIYCLDLEERYVAEVRNWARRNGQAHRVHAELFDGLEFVRQYPGAIDLLYLDFWTEDPAGSLFGTGRESAYLEAFLTAVPKLAPQALILIDDTDRVAPFKHTKIVPEARKHGYHMLWTGRQTMLARGIFGRD